MSILKDTNKSYNKSNNKMQESCGLCPRKCGALRNDGVRGFCGETDRVRIARAALHMWEEPCISGTRGSGTVFFTGCVLRCVFCQNHELADSSVGKEISVERLAEIFLELQKKGANNVNLVTPTHFVPQIASALRIAKERGLTIPVVYNTGGYESAETLKLLEGLVDVYLPDLKYASAELAAKYSLAADYPKVAQAAIAEMVRQVGEPQWTPEIGESNPDAVYEREDDEPIPLMTRGVIVRHLMLPGQLADSKDVVRTLYETYGNKIYISIMNQYTPMPGVGERFPELSHRVKKSSYEKLVDYAISLGVEQAFVQDGETAKESFIPVFDYQGV